MPRHFGILVPATNTTCEIEFCRLPAELQVHTARLGKAKGSPFSPVSRPMLATNRNCWARPASR